MIYVAYDGSIIGDWVSRYAIQMAAHSSPAELHIVHVLEPGKEKIPADKIQRIKFECSIRNVNITITEKPLQHDLLFSIVSMLDPDSLVICGIRRRNHSTNQRSLLKNSLAGLLLEHKAFDVLAIRVLHPGLLGIPHRMILPLHADLPSPITGLKFLQPLAHDLHRIHLIELITTSRIPYQSGNSDTILEQKLSAERLLKTYESDLANALGIGSEYFDSSVRLTHAWPHEVIVRAGRHKAQLIFMGLPKRSLYQKIKGIYPLEEVLRDAPCDVAVFGRKR